MQVDSGQGGGFLLAPVEVSQRFLQKADSDLWLRRLATKETLVNAISLGIASLETDLGDADWTPELKAPSQSEIKLGGRELTPHQITKEVLIGNRLIERSTRSIVDLVLGRLGYKFAATFENAYFNADGNQKPLGLFVTCRATSRAGREPHERLPGPLRPLPVRLPRRGGDAPMRRPGDSGLRARRGGPVGRLPHRRTPRRPVRAAPDAPAHRGALERGASRPVEPEAGWLRPAEERA